MIAKNGEEVLARCPVHVTSLADEITAMDTGSTDKTKGIVAGFTDKLYDSTRCDGFFKARSYLSPKATQDLIMWLDVDDVILQKDQEQLMGLKQRLQLEASIMMMRYYTAFGDRGSPTSSYYWERLMSRRMQHHRSGVTHEAIPLAGMVQYEDIATTYQKLHINDPDCNLHIFEKLLARGKQPGARE